MFVVTSTTTCQSNNSVLEMREGRPSPVIIDFGKSVCADRGQTSFG